MDDLSNKTALVYDCGLCVELALRLAREGGFGRVLYFMDWKQNLPVSAKAIVGDGFDEIERVHDFFDAVPDTDIFIFPDVMNGDLQLHLEGLGKRVWGSRRAEKYELRRSLFKETLKEVGLPVNPYEVIVGIRALREYLKSHDDQWVKISTYRGDGETWHHKNYRLSSAKLDALQYWYGPVADRISFMVEEELETDTEVAYDGFSIHGQYPKLGIQGYEAKNEAYIATLMEYGEMPDQVRMVNEAFAPVLKRERYANMWGTEIRVLDGVGYFTDATTRFPLPPGEIELELFSNLPQIMWHGSVGDLVEIEPAAKFAAQVMLYSRWAGENWQPMDIPDDARRWVKLMISSNPDGPYVCPEHKRNPLPSVNEEIGSVVGLGDTIEDAIEAVGRNLEGVGGFDVDVSLEPLATCLKSIHSAEDNGMEFTPQPVPEPAVILEEK